jgi:hypothetical protein
VLRCGANAAGSRGCARARCHHWSRAVVRSLISHQRAIELLEYNQESGKLFWKADRKGHLLKGKEAGSVNANGYIVIKVEQRHYPAHRLAWFIVHGIWPEQDVDHIDGKKTNNKLTNLRAVTRSVNLLNAVKEQGRSNTGIRNISFYKKKQKYYVRIQHEGKMLYSKTFSSLDAASKAAEKARSEHNPYYRW